jgi:hypothetical protein
MSSRKRLIGGKWGQAISCYMALVGRREIGFGAAEDFFEHPAVQFAIGCHTHNWREGWCDIHWCRRKVIAALLESAALR